MGELMGEPGRMVADGGAAGRGIGRGGAGMLGIVPALACAGVAGCPGGGMEGRGSEAVPGKG